jgi:hypothetical protein
MSPLGQASVVFLLEGAATAAEETLVRPDQPSRRAAMLALSVLSVIVGYLTVVAAPAAQAAIAPDTWYTVVSKNSGKCVDARGAATANDTVVQ